MAWVSESCPIGISHRRGLPATMADMTTARDPSDIVPRSPQWTSLTCSYGTDWDTPVAALLIDSVRGPTCRSSPETEPTELGVIASRVTPEYRKTWVAPPASVGWLTSPC